MFWQGSVEKAVRKTIEDVVTQAVAKLRDFSDVEAERETLKRQVEDLKIEKRGIEAGFAEERRTIEHKVGLEQRRQEQELALGKREAVLAVGESNLKAQQEQFQKNMAFMQGRFEEEVKAQRQLVEKMMERLPSAEIITNLTKKVR